ncbi:RNA polymerase sigma factor [Paenibacillus harenae]|uniref:RNA polymerase sigma factor n=1 Tax=Paenibacillus harenae TaxID=306543 RepID=UPI0027936F6E|nr:sigma-70 family RNA polymerase sigma factor [Paenibacillus harenae]MDQ0061740.1 RNA polymerase sigma-70 factor (ECF subfamily) [Paenibacillus harenae]
MSGAHDKYPAYPDEQGKMKQFEAAYSQYRSAICKYFTVKINRTVADDLTQHVFLKAAENLHRFNANSSLFTWIFSIAQNTVKNEYRSLSRKKDIISDFTSMEPQSISLDFARFVDIRIDIGSALKQLNELDQQIITLHYFVDCTLLEVARIVGMRESAVKNRLYRALEKLRKLLKEWGDIAVMSIQDRISIVSKNEGQSAGVSEKKVHRDLFDELKRSVVQLVSKFNHEPSRKVVIEIYPDLPTFHEAVGEAGAPNWFMGTYEDNTLKIVSPLNPGPEHTYASILKSTTHLFAMWLVRDINPLAPKWLSQGIGGYEAKQMSESYIRDTTAEAIRNGAIPTLAQLENDTWDFETMGGFQFSYLMVEFIDKQYGLDALNQVIRRPDNCRGIFNRSESELHEQWVHYISARF